ncbi:MAG: hypothetical protein ACYCZD_08020 [Rhodanobacter sp.]
MPIDDGQKLHDLDEVLLRQTHPEWMDEGRPVSRHFRPNSFDGGRLSSDRSSLVTAREAFEAYLATQRKTAGTWGVTVGEYGAEGLSSYSDPLADNHAHALIDFAAHDDKAQRNISKKLFKKAVDRGCLYPPDEATQTFS